MEKMFYVSDNMQRFIIVIIFYANMYMIVVFGPYGTGIDHLVMASKEMKFDECYKLHGLYI